ncbi:MAG: ribosome assembly RNA-binding protein YhbY [Polyangiaceae bacterium]|nr:ribosome assembly RNA-binding protein YhbY [Polyangiaceae bacterium]
MKAELTGKDRRHLRALGHDLDPVVQLGKQGLTDGVAAATDVALGTHELIKIKLGTECPDPADEVGEALASSLGAHLVQVLGKTILLFRPNPQKRKVFLPGEPVPKPANKAKSKPRRQRKPQKTDEERPRRPAARS